jgi:hypothetical protein
MIKEMFPVLTKPAAAIGRCRETPVIIFAIRNRRHFLFGRAVLIIRKAAAAAEADTDFRPFER